MEHVAPLGRASKWHLQRPPVGDHGWPMHFLDIITEPRCYENLLVAQPRLYEGIDEIMRATWVCRPGPGTGCTIFLSLWPACRERGLHSYQDVLDNDWPLFYRFCAACLRHGVYIHTMWHHGISVAHTDQDVDRALEGIEAALQEVWRVIFRLAAPTSWDCQSTVGEHYESSCPL